MLKYPCLVLDHDDTVVQSEETINYPYFCYILDQFRPGQTITLEEYMQGCNDYGFADMCRKWYHFTEQELIDEYRGWQAYIRQHIPSPFPGIKGLIRHYKAEGGIICVVSHSARENITRDYDAHFGLQPDAIYGWDLPEEKRKPNPYPLLDIMKRFQLAPKELLVVDDMKPAWEMAKSANVEIAFAAWGRKKFPNIRREMEEICNYTFYSPKDLETFLF